MCKVIIDAFDTQEQAVAFVDWFKKQADKGKINLVTTEGYQTVEWDGIDTENTNESQAVINITVFEDEPEYD